jgi:hypothetical protein
MAMIGSFARMIALRHDREAGSIEGTGIEKTMTGQQWGPPGR